MKLREIAYSRSGDKGDVANLCVFVYDERNWELLRRELTVEKVRAKFGDLVKGDVVRYELPGTQGLNFVLTEALGGGVSRSLRADPHGKSYQSLILDIDIDTATPADAGTASRGDVEPASWAPRPDQVSTFRRQGWIKLPRLLDDDELARLGEIYAAEEADGASTLMGQVGAGDDAAGFAYQAHPDMAKMWDNRIDLRTRWPELQHLVARYAAVAEALIGCDEVKVFWDKTFTKPPASVGTRQSVWHQDYPYNPIDRRGFVSVWVAVDDVTEEMGAMRFVPGSHRLGPLGRFDLVGREHDWHETLRPEDMELVSDPVTQPLLAGEATVHDGLTLHGAGENLSDRPRRGWTIIFIPAETRWTGGPHPHADNNIEGMVLGDAWDDPRFDVER